MTSKFRGPIAIIYLTLCLLLGGASALGAGALGNAILQIGAILIILALIWSGRILVPAEARPIAIAVFLFLGWALLTLIPLPTALWQALPYRGAIADELALLGLRDASLPVSLAPGSTINSLLGLLPPVAMFLLTVTLPLDTRRHLYSALVIMTVASVALGILQLIGGTNSSLRFYAITNQGSPVGLFSNINHHVTLILSALLCTAVLAARFATRRDRSKRSGGMILVLALAVFLLGAVAIAGSVAGYGLVIPVAFVGLLIYRRATAKNIGTAWKIGMAVLVVGFIAFALAGPVSQQTLVKKYGPTESSRRTMTATTIEGIVDTFPVGTGLGSFPNVYRRYEDPMTPQREFVNHAHNDYVEVILEQGIVGLAVILLFFWWWIRVTIRAWGADGPGASVARAGSAIIAVILLHSIVDYPLRTSAIAAVFALACALLMPPPVRQRAAKGADGEAPLKHLEV